MHWFVPGRSTVACEIWLYRHSREMKRKRWKVLRAAIMKLFIDKNDELLLVPQFGQLWSIVCVFFSSRFIHKFWCSAIFPSFTAIDLWLRFWWLSTTWESSAIECCCFISLFWRTVFDLFWAILAFSSRSRNSNRHEISFNENTFRFVYCFPMMSIIFDEWDHH